MRERADVRLVDTNRLQELFEQIEPELYRFPAIDPPTFRAAVEAATAQPLHEGEASSGA